MTENLGSFKHRGISKWKNHSGKGIAIIERDAGSRRESQVSFAVIPHLVYLDGKMTICSPKKITFFQMSKIFYIYEADFYPASEENIPDSVLIREFLSLLERLEDAEREFFLNV